MNQNPFNITFGKEPFSIISRNNELSEIYNSFSQDNPSTDVYILTGIRGSGKTVAMATIVDYFKQINNWICVELNPITNMLEQLAAKLYDEGNLRSLFTKKEFSFSFSGLGFSISGENPVVNISSFLKRELEYLQKKNMRVLITVDEVITNEYVKVFAHEFQSFLREKYPVCLVMTGLYQNVSQLEKQKSLTFLYRAPKIYLGELNVRAIANSYKNIFEIGEKESVELSKLTCGYAFAYQLLGSILFESGKNKLDEQVIDKFDELLQERSYDIIYNELTGKEKEILKYAAIDNSNDYVISKANISRSQLSQYKKVLYLKGIIQENRNNIIFRLPRFKEFMMFVIDFES